jgi:hypothetical protein
MKVFMDDERDPPTGEDVYGRPYTIYDVVCRHPHEAIKLLDEGKVSFISLDHFMDSGEMTGLDVAKYILSKAVSGELARVKWDIHTSSKEFLLKIYSVMSSADDAWDDHEDAQSKK